MCHEHDPGGPHPDGVNAEPTTVELADGTRLPVYVARPDGQHARPQHAGPGVVVLVDIYGRSAFYEGIARRVAAAGFQAYVPDPFHREGPLDSITIEAAFARRARWDEPRAFGEYVELVDLLRRQLGACGVVGFCLGGTEALLLAADRPGVPTVCCYGFPAGTPAPPGAPTLGAPLDRVDDLRGPILGLWGDQDARVGMDNVAALAGALETRGASFEHRVLPGLDHGFLAAIDDTDSPVYDQAMAAWARAMEFLAEHLPDGRAPHPSASVS